MKAPTARPRTGRALPARTGRAPSPALIVALIALFVSLGGVSYGFATGAISSREIKDNTIRGKDIRKNQVTAREIKRRSIDGTDIKRNRVGGNAVKEQVLEAGKIGKVSAAIAADLLGGLSAAQIVEQARGNTGPAGPQGPAGPSGQTAFALDAPQKPIGSPSSDRTAVFSNGGVAFSVRCSIDVGTGNRVFSIRLANGTSGRLDYTTWSQDGATGSQSYGELPAGMNADILSRSAEVASEQAWRVQWDAPGGPSTVEFSFAVRPADPCARIFGHAQHTPR